MEEVIVARVFQWIDSQSHRRAHLIDAEEAPLEMSTSDYVELLLLKFRDNQKVKVTITDIV